MVKQQAVQAAVTVATLSGALRWVPDNLRHGCQSIAIQADGEMLPADAQGRTPLRGITLSREATVEFYGKFCNTLFIGDNIDVSVRTEDLVADLGAGKGTKGKPYFIGVAVK